MAKEAQRDEYVSYLNTTPTGNDDTWGLLGEGITSYVVNLNPQISNEKYIINKVSTPYVSGYQPQGDINQKMMFGDACYDYVNDLRRTEAIGDTLKTEILDIDKYDSITANSIISYKALKHDCLVVPTSYGGGERGEIGYSIHYSGNGTKGTVTFSNGAPTFTADV